MSVTPVMGLLSTQWMPIGTSLSLFRHRFKKAFALLKKPQIMRTFKTALAKDFMTCLHTAANTV
ncbi:hypothetical protein AUP68_00863 [Ilyonectria robusta]